MCAARGHIEPSIVAGAARGRGGGSSVLKNGRSGLNGGVKSAGNTRGKGSRGGLHFVMHVIRDDHTRQSCNKGCMRLIRRIRIRWIRNEVGRIRTSEEISPATGVP